MNHKHYIWNYDNCPVQDVTATIWTKKVENYCRQTNSVYNLSQLQHIKSSSATQETQISANSEKYIVYRVGLGTPKWESLKWEIFIVKEEHTIWIQDSLYDLFTTFWAVK